MLDLREAVSVLERTPGVLAAWLGGLPPGWTEVDEGPDTFSPFEPFDRFAMWQAAAGRSMPELLAEFKDLRASSLKELGRLEILEEDFVRVGLHPELGKVTLGQLIATWVVHDLGHIGQIARVMSRRYGGDVGPWRAYLPVLAPRRGRAD